MLYIGAIYAATKKFSSVQKDPTYDSRHTKGEPWNSLMKVAALQHIPGYKIDEKFLTRFENIFIKGDNIDAPGSSSNLEAQTPNNQLDNDVIAGALCGIRHVHLVIYIVSVFGVGGLR